MRLFARKTEAELQAEAFAAEDEHSLRRALSALNLTTLGIGVIIGARIFVLAGRPLPSTPARPFPSPSCSRARCARSQDSATPSLL